MVTIACLFFADRFQVFVASDIAPEAVECTKKNLRLVSSAGGARQRLEHVRGMQNMNERAGSSWGEVAPYLEKLLPVIEQNERLAPVLRTFTASAFQLPLGIDGSIHFVGDLPYGRTSYLCGNRSVKALFDCIIAAYPKSTMTFVMTHGMAEGVLGGTENLTIDSIPCKNGRLIVRATPRRLADAANRGQESQRTRCSS